MSEMVARLAMRTALQRRTLHEAPIADGPVELWLVFVDRYGQALAAGPVDLGKLRPESISGTLNLVSGPIELTTVGGVEGQLLGEATQGWVVMVNRAEGSYAKVFPIHLVVPMMVRAGDVVTISGWEWWIRPESDYLGPDR